MVDATGQEKAAMFQTDARLMHLAREKRVRLANKAQGVDRRQSYPRGGQDRADHASALRPRKAVQARQQRCAQSAPIRGGSLERVPKKLLDFFDI